MKRLFGYLIGLFVMLGVFASLYLAGAIYDTSDRVTINPYFFRLGLRASEQIGKPQPLADVQNRKLRDWLVQKYIYEYLYIEPNENNIDMRMSSYSNLDYMSSEVVFKKWKNGVGKTIQDLASRGVRRTVFVYDEILQSPESDYLQVDYETKTWYKPNDMTEVPTVKRGTAYLKIDDADGPVHLKPSKGNEIPKALIDGIDPAVVFTFLVNDIIIDEK